MVIRMGDDVDFSDFNKAILQLQQQIRDRKYRNPEVLALLDLYRHIASKHKMSGVVMALINYPPRDPTTIGRETGTPRKDFWCTDWAGDTVLQVSMVEALKEMIVKLEQSIEMWKAPLRDPSLDYSYVCYNAAIGSISFDFIAWLIDMEMTRVRHGSPAPLKVAFWFGRDDCKLTPEKVNWLNNVFRPALKLIGAVEDQTALHGYAKDFVCTRDIVAAYKAGEKVPLLRPPQALKPGQAPVTITLRESIHWLGRNSNLKAWKKFARWLIKQGEKVVFVRDTAKIAEPLDEFYTYPAASINLTDRMALYECAKINLFISNGPWSLALFGSKPWLMFLEPLTDDAEFAANTPTFWRDMNGVPHGEQYPWSTDQQRIVWTSDTFENLVSAWKTYVEPPAIARLPLAIAK